MLDHETMGVEAFISKFEQEIREMRKNRTSDNGDS